MPGKYMSFSEAVVVSILVTVVDCMYSPMAVTRKYMANAQAVSTTSTHRSFLTMPGSEHR